MYNNIVHVQYELKRGIRMANKVFSERIKILRKNSGMTMDVLAKQLDVTKSRINMWENNGTVPRDEMLLKISNLFNVSVDYLLGNDNMQGLIPQKKEIQILQRGLENLNKDDLDKAKSVLSVVFGDIFAEEEEHGNL